MPKTSLPLTRRLKTVKKLKNKYEPPEHSKKRTPWSREKKPEKSRTQKESQKAVKKLSEEGYQDK